MVLLDQALPLGSRFMGLSVPAFDAPPAWFDLENLSGLRFSLGNLLSLQAAQLFFSFMFIVCVLSFRLVLRKQWLAITAVVLISSGVDAFVAQSPYVPLVLGIAASVFTFGILFRFGLLPVVVAGYVESLLRHFPMTFDLSAWYASNTILVLVVIAALTVYGSRVALAGRAIFKDDVIRD